MTHTHHHCYKSKWINGNTGRSKREEEGSSRVYAEGLPHPTAHLQDCNRLNDVTNLKPDHRCSDVERDKDTL
jgi:hypothetical protein